jgi:A118 family predicted phage portal protein
MISLFWSRVVEAVKRLFGLTSVEPAPPPSEYTDAGKFNVTAIVAHRLAAIAVSEARVTLDGADALGEALRCVTDDLLHITRNALGFGGMVLKPYTRNGKILLETFPQSRLFIAEREGNRLRKFGFLADWFRDERENEFARYELHTLADGLYRVENKATRNGAVVALDVLPQWKDIQPVIELTGVSDPLFGFIRCPADDRNGAPDFMGVPVTFGCETLIEELGELLKGFQREFVRKETFIGADRRLFKEANGEKKLPDSGLYVLFEGAKSSLDDSNFWQIFSPEIRDTSFINGVNYKLSQIEKAIGVSSGILTDMATRAATATEIEYSSFDTESYADAIHKNIERGVRDALAACAVYSTAMGLSVADNYELTFDWMNWSERSSTRFGQLLDGAKSGAVNPEEIRMYLFDEDIETAKGRIKHEERPVAGFGPDRRTD